MKSVRLVAVVLLVMGIAAGASAQATRTWVSGVGDDVNPCSRTAPCKTFAGAISKTATNGIINVIDSAGFGPVTVTKSITIDASPFMGGVLAAGTTGIFINAAGATVNLRGLDIEGATTGTNGINVAAAANVVIERCNIFGFNAAAPNGNGIQISTTAPVNVVVRDTTISNNTQMGIRATTSGVVAKLILENVRLWQNGQNGLDLVNNVQANAVRSSMSQNGASGARLEAASSSLEGYQTSFDGNGGFGLNTAGTNQVKIFECQIVHNSSGSISAAAGVVTHGNNAIQDNATATQPGSSATPVATNGQQ